MKNQSYLFVFLLLFSFWISCTPKANQVNNTTSLDKPKTNKVKIDLSGSEFENFTYEIESGGKYVETVLDKSPEPLNGEKKFFMAMYRKMNYPPIARENGVSGTVLIRVVLNEFGQLEDSEIVKDIGAGCGEEALKAVRRGFESPVEAAMLAGNRVKVRFGIPVHFKLH